MESDLYRDALRAEIGAAFRALEPTLDAKAREDGAFAALVLEAFGDAIRLGCEVPTPIRAWCRQLDDERLSFVLEGLRAEVASWNVPTPGSVDVELDRGFDLLRRDHAESTLRSVAWLCLDRGHSPTDLPEWRDCAEAIGRFDGRLTMALDRARAETLLGPRVRLLGDRDWTSLLQDRVDTPNESVAVGLEGSPSRRPSDVAVQQYVSEGINQRLVEGHAVRNVEFGDDLADVIDTFKEMNQNVGIAAWRWRRDRQKEKIAGEALPLRVEARRFARAASDAAELGLDRKELGRLPGLLADATLEVDGEQVTLRVFTQIPLVEIGLGDAKSTTPVSSGPTAIWEIGMRLQHGPIEIRVVAADGQTFADRIELIPE